MTTNVEIKRSVGLAGGTSMIVGMIIGSGIFISPKGVLEGSGSVGLCLILWICGGGLTMCAALSYAELGTMFPRHGGTYSYILEGGPNCLAFIYSYSLTIITKPCGIAISALTCARYLLVPFYSDGCGVPPSEQIKLLAVVLIFTLYLVNSLSAKGATKVLIFITSLKLVAMVIIVIGGIYNIWKGSTQYLMSGFEGTNTNPGEIAVGFYSTMWAYGGWQNLNNILEELKDPHRNLPRAMMIGIPMVAFLYLFINISYFTVLSPQELLDAPAVSIAWAEGLVPELAWIIPICVALSTFGHAHASLFAGGRILYAVSKQKHSVRCLSMIHVGNCIPMPAVLFTVIIATLFLSLLDVYALIKMVQFVIWTFYGVVFALLLIMRLRRPNAPRPYRVPTIFPVMGLLASAFIILVPIIISPRIEMLYGVGLVLSGFIFYVPFVLLQYEIPKMRYINIGIQLLMQVCPPDSLKVDEQGKSTSL